MPNLHKRVFFILKAISMCFGRTL